MTKRKALSLSQAAEQDTIAVTVDKVKTNKPKSVEPTQEAARPHSMTFYLPKSWHVLLKKEAAVADGIRVNDYVLQGLELLFKQKGIEYPERN